MKYIKKLQSGGTTNKDRINYYREYINSPKYKERIFNAQNESTGKSMSKGILDKLTQTTIDKSNDAINTVNIFPIDPKDKVNTHKFIDGIYGAYSPMAHTIFHKKTDRPIMGEVIIHELSHASSLGNKLIPPYTQTTVPELVGQKRNSYYGDPTEIKARFDSLRFYAKQKGLYDAGKEDFTKKHLDKILNDPFMNKQYFMKEIKEKYLKNPSNFIKAMNIMADSGGQNNVLKAQSGSVINPLAPILPKEATFDDEVPVNETKPKSKVKKISFNAAFGDARKQGLKVFT